MANEMLCTLVTPSASLLDEPVTYASVPLWDGLMGFLPGRAPILARVGLGELTLRFPDSKKGGGGTRSYYIEDGFVQMADNRLRILADKAIPAEEITRADAEAELRAAANDAKAGARARAKLQILDRGTGSI